MNLFSSSNAYLMKFDNINGLSASTPIYANGYKVGTVHSIAYNYTQPGDITVVADIEKDMKIPEGTEAEIVSDLMGNIQVNLVLGTSSQYLPTNGVIPGHSSNSAMEAVKGMVCRCRPCSQNWTPSPTTSTCCWQTRLLRERCTM